MIVATLRIAVAPKKKADFIQLMRQVFGRTRVEEGCISYHFYQDIENKNTFILVEEWKTLDDFKKHIRTDKYKMLLEMVDLSSCEPPEFKFNMVSHTEGMEFIEEVRCQINEWVLICG